MNFKIVFFFLLIPGINIHAAENVVLSSPNGRIECSFFIDDSRELSYSVKFNDKLVIFSSRIGIDINHEQFEKNIIFGEARHSYVNESYKQAGGSGRIIDNVANSIYIPLISADGHSRFALEGRAYDDGVAWRLHFTDANGGRVFSESSSWTLPGGSRVWFSERNNNWKLKTYAGEWIDTDIDSLDIISPQGAIQCPPLVVELPSHSGYALITEAALQNYSGMRLRVTGNRRLQVDFTEGDSGFEVDGCITTPWRVTVLVNDLNGLVNSNLIDNLNPPPNPALFGDMGYIKPGRSVWRWWSSGTGTPEEERSYIDFAAKLGFEYSMVDDGWIEWPNAWDKLKELVDYARSKQVEVIVWSEVTELKHPEHDWGNLREFLDKAKATGVSCVKLDFINSESKESIDFQLAALRLAAERKLMVIFHGIQKPTGERRTFPNEITREAVRGLELNKIMTEGTLPASHNAALPYTRFVVGPADYTPLSFSKPGSTTWAHQLATLVQFTSPIQVICEDPEMLLTNEAIIPVLDIIKAMPTVWDETHVLPSSRIGELSIIARRHGEEWFLSGLSGNSPVDIQQSLSFLGSGAYDMILIKGASDTSFVREEVLSVHSETALNLVLDGSDGFICWLKPKASHDRTFGITTLTPPRLDTNPGPAYWPRMRLWQGVPSIERTPNGRLWATWYTGGIGEGKGHNYQLLVTSDDDGYTWSKPVAVLDPSRQLLGGEGGNAHLWLDPNGRLWWFIYRTMPAPGLHPRTTWGFYTEEPENPNPTWKGPVFAGYGYSLSKGIVLSDGTWMHMVDPISKLTNAAPQIARKGAHVYQFNGYDRPFSHVGHVEIQETPFTEHMVVEKKDGTLWMLARATYGLAQAFSMDKGRTWEEGEPFTKEFNVNTRFYFGKLASGNLLLIVNDHPKKRQNMTAMLSEDEGKTWPYKLVLDEREFVSYPDATQISDGTIYAIYDRGRYQKDMQEILMAKFTEEDIKAGTIVNSSSRLKQTINKLADEGGGVHYSGESFEMTKQFQEMKAPSKPLELEEGEKAEYKQN